MSESLAWCLCSSHQLPLQQLPSLLARTRDGASQGHSALEQGSQDSQPPALVSQSASSPALPPPRAFLIFYISYSGMGRGLLWVEELSLPLHSSLSCSLFCIICK